MPLPPIIALSIAVLVFITVVLFGSLYIFFIYRWPKEQEYYYYDRPFIFGHRGSPTKRTENTILSFEKAIEQGVDGLEFDIRLTQDKKIVIFHDLDLKRLMGKDQKISEQTYKQLQEYSFKDNTKIPLLNDIVPLLEKTKAVNIEIKSKGMCSGHSIIRPLICFLNKHNIDDKCIVSSFNPLILWRLKRERPQTIIGFLYIRTVLFPSWYNCIWIMRVRPDSLHIHYSLLGSWIVKWARGKGMRINSYTINDKKVFNGAKIDGVFTDNIEYIK